MNQRDLIKLSAPELLEEFEKMANKMRGHLYQHELARHNSELTIKEENIVLRERLKFHYVLLFVAAVVIVYQGWR